MGKIPTALNTAFSPRKTLYTYYNRFAKYGIVQNMAEFLEACMIISFGLSWPTSIIKSWKVRTAKGKSLLFLIFVEIGYVCGISAKLIAGNISYVFPFYVLNFVMVGTDIVLCFRNRALDRQESSLR